MPIYGRIFPIMWLCDPYNVYLQHLGFLAVTVRFSQIPTQTKSIYIQSMLFSWSVVHILPCSMLCHTINTVGFVSAVSDVDDLHVGFKILKRHSYSSGQEVCIWMYISVCKYLCVCFRSTFLQSCFHLLLRYTDVAIRKCYS